MITLGRARTRNYRITGVSSRRHAAAHDYAVALVPVAAHGSASR
jgi:hypothetical protein